MEKKTKYITSQFWNKIERQFVPSITCGILGIYQRSVLT